MIPTQLEAKRSEVARRGDDRALAALLGKLSDADSGGAASELKLTMSHRAEGHAEGPRCYPRTSRGCEGDGLEGRGS